MRSGDLTAWGGAWLAGRVVTDAVLERCGRGTEAVLVEGLPGEAAPRPLSWLLSWLRAEQVRVLRLVLPVPGDPSGLPGPGPFTAAAMTAGEGVVAVGADRVVGLVPAEVRHGTDAEGSVVSICWRFYAVPEPTGGGSATHPVGLPDAEAELTAALRDTTATLTALDVARWRDDVAGPLQELREGRCDEAVLPPGYPSRAARLLASADRLATVLDLAARDSGAAVAAAEVRGRAEALSGLARAVRHARTAAYNALEPAPRR